MHILEYQDLDKHGLSAVYDKTVAKLARGDWSGVKKLSPTRYFRARLDGRNRLLFLPMQHRGQPCLLLLEVIRNHAYEHSRFLRGAIVQHDQLVELAQAPEVAALESLPVLPSGARCVRALDKFLAFDTQQEALLHQALPLIVVGSAGSGKTALTLERMKSLRGDVLYVTQSRYLAEHARNVYYGLGYQPQEQNPEFLSFAELLETIQIAPGRELRFADFQDFLQRHAGAVLKRDGHMLYEEFRGVLVGTRVDCAQLTRADYLALGARQSIFLADERDGVYALFEQYLQWLSARGLTDSSRLAQQYLATATARYDFVVVDEVQDMTIAQLALVLAQLKQRSHFLLCGDANQIVHPNFFSWAQVKTLFWQDPKLAERQSISVLQNNYRNSRAVTAIANRLIKLKQRRFGSIDRESNFLIQPVAERCDDRVEFLKDSPALRRELDEKTRESTQFAVLVLREEHKAQARAHFRTPLVFSVLEAKGLEYENIIAYNLVSDSREAFRDIAADISPAALDGEQLKYARAADKDDKSLERYKFYINALYVAITRAIARLYLIESDSAHPLLALLALQPMSQDVSLARQRSSQDDWSREARKLELQGRGEQAEAIRSKVLKLTPVPWPVFHAEHFRTQRARALDPKNISANVTNQVREYAAAYLEPQLYSRLSGSPLEHGFPAKLKQARVASLERHLAPYRPNKPIKPVLSEVHQYGIEFRNPLNFTPLMLATLAGNLSLVQALLQAGANSESVDSYGRNAVQLLLGGLCEAATKPETQAELYRLLAPASIDVQHDRRLLKVDQRSIEFLLLNMLIGAAKELLQDIARPHPTIRVQMLSERLARLGDAIISPERTRTTYLSGVLARNELHRDYPYNRRIFLRVGHGAYVLNPALEIRDLSQAEAPWVPLQDRLQLRLIAEDGDPAVINLLKMQNTMLRSPAQRHAEALAEVAQAQAQARAQAEAHARALQAKAAKPHRQSRAQLLAEFRALNAKESALQAVKMQLKPMQQAPAKVPEPQVPEPKQLKLDF